MRSGVVVHLRPRRSDAGFTLIEMLIVIAILGVIMLPLGDVVIGIARNTKNTSDRVTLSHDAQLAATYFAQDVAGTGVRDYSGSQVALGTVPYKQSVQLNAAYNAGAAVCGTSSTPTAVLRLLSDDWDISGTDPAVSTDVVAYYLKSTSDGTELHRLRCSGSSTPTSDITVAHNVSASTVAVTCSSTCESTTVPQRITLSFSLVRGTLAAYPVTLTGQRRQT